MNLQYILNLCVFFTNDVSLQLEVKQAYKQPKQYLQKFKVALEERGIEEIIQNLTWIALVDGLERRGLMQELDWKDSPEELITLVEELTKKYKNQQEIHNTLSTLVPLLNDDIEEYLTILNLALEKHEIQLIWIDIESDSYPLGLINLSDIHTAKDFAQKIGLGKIVS